MEVTLSLPAYQPETGLPYTWLAGFTMQVAVEQGQVVLSANKAGLISLATQLLTLAQADVPASSHFHYDHYNSLEDGSTELVIQKAE